MVRVHRPADFHHDHVATLQLVDAVEAGLFIVHLVKAGVVLTLPPAVGALEGFELQAPFAPVPVANGDSNTRSDTFGLPPIC